MTIQQRRREGLSNGTESARRERGAVKSLSRGLECLCESDACTMVVRFVLGHSRGDWELTLQCEYCNRLFQFPCIEWQWDSAGLLEVVDQARKGNQAAKDALVLILETERKTAIFWKLSVGDVRPTDRADGHHDVIVKIDQNIERLRVTRAYFKWEDRIINSVCKAWRRTYRSLGESLEAVQETRNSGELQ